MKARKSNWSLRQIKCYSASLDAQGYYNNPYHVSRDIWVKGKDFARIYKKHIEEANNCINNKNIKGARYHNLVQAEMRSKGRILSRNEVKDIWNKLTKKYG